MAKVLSVEDGNLQTPSIITTRKVNYLDIDLAFEAKSSGDIFKKKDAAAVKQAVKNLLLTVPGEKPFDPYFGGGLAGLIFELVDADAEDEIEEAIRSAIINYEPRAKVQKIDFQFAPDRNSIGVRITFQIVNTEEQVVLETDIARVR